MSEIIGSVEQNAELLVRSPVPIPLPSQHNAHFGRNHSPNNLHTYFSFPLTYTQRCFFSASVFFSFFFFSFSIVTLKLPLHCQTAPSVMQLCVSMETWVIGQCGCVKVSLIHTHVQMMARFWAVIMYGRSLQFSNDCAESQSNAFTYWRHRKHITCKYHSEPHGLVRVLWLEFVSVCQSQSWWLASVVNRGNTIRPALIENRAVSGPSEIISCDRSLPVLKPINPGKNEIETHGPHILYSTSCHWHHTYLSSLAVSHCTVHTIYFVNSTVLVNW